MTMCVLGGGNFTWNRKMLKSELLKCNSPRETQTESPVSSLFPADVPWWLALDLPWSPFAQALQPESGVYGSQAVFLCLHASHLCGLLKSCCPGPVGFAGRVFNHLHWKPARFCWPPVLDPSFPVSLNVPGMPNADIYVLAVLCMHFFFLKE